MQGYTPNKERWATQRLTRNRMPESVSWTVPVVTCIHQCGYLPCKCWHERRGSCNILEAQVYCECKQPITWILHRKSISVCSALITLGAGEVRHLCSSVDYKRWLLETVLNSKEVLIMLFASTHFSRVAYHVQLRAQRGLRRKQPLIILCEQNMNTKLCKANSGTHTHTPPPPLSIRDVDYLNIIK